MSLQAMLFFGLCFWLPS
jgi:hypothetical protein